MKKIKTKLAACAICVASFVTPAMLTVANTPHPDHPGHVHGVTLGDVNEGVT